MTILAKLSPTMREAALALREAGRLEYLKGGFWITPGTPMKRPGVPERYFSTTTVHALVRREIAVWSEYRHGCSYGHSYRFPVAVAPA